MATRMTKDLAAHKELAAAEEALAALRQRCWELAQVVWGLEMTIVHEHDPGTRLHMDVWQPLTAMATP